MTRALVAVAAAPTDSVGARLAQVAEPLLGAERAAEVAAGGSGALLDALVAAVLADPAPDHVWLLLTGLSGAFPDDAQMRRTLRLFATADHTTASIWLLDHALGAAVDAGTAGLAIHLVTDAVVVDVSHSAEHDLHTGIQRVVRSTLPLWAATHDIEPVVMRSGGTAMRRLRPRELDRVLRWSEAVTSTDGHGRRAKPVTGDQPDDVLVVPWRSAVVLLEVPGRDACARLAALGEWSGNRLTAVGYDCIPIVSSLVVPLAEPNRFVHYLTAVKYTDVVAGISVSATEEFRGFADMLPAQGLAGPRVVECALPVDDGGGRPATGTPAARHRDDPLVLCVGSFEPRKNQEAVLYAAEVLWREGLRFRLRFIGGSAWGNGVAREVASLARRGRPVELLRAVGDDELEAGYREARFTVFVSRHEGYGLPLAESLARGIPALTTDFGSQREIADAGGALQVDPRDDDAIVDGLRRLLTDDDLVDDLRRQIAARPTRTWADYAAELWTALGLPTGEPAGAAAVVTPTAPTGESA